MSRPANTYRAARRNRCRETSIVIWRPASGLGTPPDNRPKYGGAALRAIRAIKGVGRPPKPNELFYGGARLP